MADWVSKTDLIAHLEECIAESDGCTPIVDSVLLAIKCAVEQMPTVDGVPAVRCKDCKHHDVVSGSCDYHAASTLDGWYCWNGERRDNNGWVAEK